MYDLGLMIDDFLFTFLVAQKSNKKGPGEPRRGGAAHSPFSPH
jgi:hypothetical protein